VSDSFVGLQTAHATYDICNVLLCATVKNEGEVNVNKTNNLFITCFLTMLSFRVERYDRSQGKLACTYNTLMSLLS